MSADIFTEKIEVAPTALELNQAFVSICLAYGFTNPTLASYKASQGLIQAMYPDAPPLLQLPHFTQENIKKIEDAALSSQRKHLTVQNFMDLPEAQRKELTKNAGLTSAQYDTAIDVATQLPRLVIEKAFFKVAGEKYVLPSSLVQYVVKARFIPPGSTNIPAVSPSDLEDVDVDESDAKTRREQEAEKQQQHQPSLAHAPLFARDHSPKWHMFLTDARQGKIAVPPFTFQTFDKPIVDAEGKPTYNVQTLKMQFQAPPQAGEYRFQMHLICDSYVGFDYKMDATMVIDDASRAAEVDEEDEISEPEEGKLDERAWSMKVICADTVLDTIAGQMAALRGTAPDSKTASKKRRPAKVEEVNSDEEESDTDEDESSASETDTDTDTDEE